jgi:hypothetical protein
MQSTGCSGLLCDLDGVVRRWPAHVVASAEDAAGLPRGSLHATAFAADLLPLVITGRTDEAREVDAEERRMYAAQLRTVLERLEPEPAVPHG